MKSFALAYYHTFTTILYSFCEVSETLPADGVKRVLLFMPQDRMFKYRQSQDLSFGGPPRESFVNVLVYTNFSAKELIAIFQHEPLIPRESFKDDRRSF